MANTKVQSEQIEDGSITADKLADGTIVAAELADNAVTTAKINADAVTGAKIADDAIDSEHYTDGSIDTAHIADAQITVAKMAANSVDSDQYVDGSIDTVHLGDLQVTTAKIANGNISTAKIADNAVTSAKIDTNIDIAGTFDVTGATTLDAGLTVDTTTLVVDATNNRVGIGTASPVAELNVDGRIVIDDGARSNPTGGASLVLDYQTTSNLEGRIRSRDWDGAAWKDLTIEANDINLIPDGNVGIGTTSPNDKLHIKIGTNLNWQFGYPNSSVTTLAALNDAESAYVEGRIDASNLILNSQSGGNVGIGTTSPDNKLHIYAGDSGHTWSYDSGDYFIIENSDSVAMNMASPSSNQNLILFSDNAARGIGLIGYNHNEDTLRFHANGEQRLKLDGASSGEAAMKITQGSETGGQLLIRSNYSDPHYLATQGTNHSSGGWYWGYGVQMSGSGTTKSTFSNFSGSRSFVQLFGDRIQYNFAGAQNTTIGNSVSLTESVRIDAQGIKFNGDTATANALSDYEEGSWTPTSAVTLTTTTACRYVKVGNQVTITFDIEFATTSSGNQVTFGNLPFSLTTYNGGYTNWQNTGSGVHLHCSGTNAYLYNIVSNAAFTLAAVSGKRIIGTIVGIVA